MGTLQEKVRRFQKKTITELRDRQNADGSWAFCFEEPIMTNSFFILLLTSLDEGENEKELISSLAAGIHAKQQPDGTFINYPDETRGNLTATVQGYVGMLASECFHRSEPHMKKAEQFIISHGGLRHVHFMTKWMLAANGLYPCLLCIYHYHSWRSPQHCRFISISSAHMPVFILLLWL